MFKGVSEFWGDYGSSVMDGVVNTLLLSIICILLGSIIGFSIGFARNIHFTRKDNFFTKSIKYAFKFIWDAYIAFFRYTPFIAQAFFFSFVIFKSMDAFPVGIIVLSINTSAYIAIIVEGGISSVDKGQYQAGRSLGLSHFKTYTKIIMPQAFKNMVGALSNEYVNVIKGTSILSTIEIKDLMFEIKKGSGSSFQYAAGYGLSLIIYFFICFAFVLLLKLFNYLLERRR